MNAVPSSGNCLEQPGRRGFVRAVVETREGPMTPARLICAFATLAAAAGAGAGAAAEVHRRGQHRQALT